MATPPLLDISEGIALITDGSADYRNRSGGWAYVAIDACEGLHATSGSRSAVTNNQMELVAPTEGLSWLHRALGACEVLVYSDSLYVVLGATDKTRKRLKNKKYWHDLDRAADLHSYVEFIHVKGHTGHLWNEMADQLAGKARLEGAENESK